MSLFRECNITSNYLFLHIQHCTQHCTQLPNPSQTLHKKENECKGTNQNASFFFIFTIIHKKNKHYNESYCTLLLVGL